MATFAEGRDLSSVKFFTTHNPPFVNPSKFPDFPGHLHCSVEPAMRVAIVVCALHNGERPTVEMRPVVLKG
jgi:hypothetical protein